MKYVYIVRDLRNGYPTAVFSNPKLACAFADLIDCGQPDPDYDVLKVEVRSSLPHTEDNPK